MGIEYSVLPMKRLRDHIDRFRQWQKEPYPVAPISRESRVCPACDTEYQGNFCPRCGQSSKIEKRMSLWKTFLLFIDVWGVGNSGMFHTIRDLILRPGYLISDYLTGKRSAYFPPFKLLFLLTTLSLVVGSGFNIWGIDYTKDYHLDTIDIQSSSEAIILRFSEYWNYMTDLQDRFPALFRLGVMMITCVFYYINFRNSRRIGLISFHEFFIAMVYMVNMANIYSIVFRFFGAPEWLVAIPTFLYIIPLQQLTGYSALKTALRFILTWLMIVCFFIILFFLTLILIVGLYS